MDIVTQAALGAACAQAALNKKDRNNAWIAGAVGGIAADLDVLIRSSTDPMLLFIYHRHFTHALSFIPVGGLLVGLALLIFPRFRKTPIWTFAAALIGYATHGVLDACTSYGTLLFWPFSYTRVAWDIISIIDPRFTIPLILGLAWTLVFKQRKGVILGLLCALAFLGFNAWQHHRVLYTLQEYAVHNQLAIRHLRVFPALASTTRWYGIFFENNQMGIAEVFAPWFKPTQIHQQSRCPLFRHEHLPLWISREQHRDFHVFDWFTDSYMIQASATPLTLVDGRYFWEENPLIGFWGIQFLPENRHVKRIGRTTLEACQYE